METGLVPFARHLLSILPTENPSLVPSYSMKVLHVSGLCPGDTIYLPSENARLQSMIFLPVAITDRSESPAVQTRVGRGYFAYIGDVNAEEGSTKLFYPCLACWTLRTYRTLRLHREPVLSRPDW